MIAIRAGSGLGDSIYLQSVVRHLIDTEELPVEVCTNYPEVFAPIAGRVTLSPFRKDRINRIAHYSGRKKIGGTDQFQDMCITAGIKDSVDLRLDWKTVEPKAIRTLQAVDKPIIVVSMPRAPWGRVDGFGMEILPNCGRIQQVIRTIGKAALFVQVGRGRPLYRFSGIDLDLTNRTTIHGLVDVAHQADGFLGYCSYIIPLAESFKKPELLIWSRRGLNAKGERASFIRTVTPEKVLHRSSSKSVVDDCSDDELRVATDELFDQAANSFAVRREIGGDRGERARVA